VQVAVFHPGTQHSWQTALALQHLGRLEWYATSLLYRPNRVPFLIERFIPGQFGRQVRREFSRFAFPALDDAKVLTLGQGSEWLERVAARSGLNRTASWLNQRGNRVFAKLLARSIAAPQPFALWGYNSSSLEAFRQGKAVGRHCILDRTIGDWRYFRRKMELVRETHGDWLMPTSGKLDDAQIELEDREMELADTILCGCEFAAQTLRDHAPADAIAGKLRVLPYCFDQGLFGATPMPAPVSRNEPVRFLFLGQVTARKGIQHVLEAIAALPRSEAELTIVGRIDIPSRNFARYADRITHVPIIPRNEVPAIMARHHCLLFPSYFEGSALTLLEGLASGLALIQTPQAGNGVSERTGIMLERPDTDLLLTAMRRVIDDRDLLDSFRVNAQAEAENYSFARYEKNIAGLLEELAG